MKQKPSSIESEVLDVQRERRQALRRGISQDSARLVEALLAGLFAKQRAFIDDPARQKAALCSRRAGKTFLNSSYLVVSALRNPSSENFYVVRNRERAKEVLWTSPRSGLPHVLERHGVRVARVDNTSLKVFFPNGSTVELFGTEDVEQTRKLHGRQPDLVIVDEAQDLPPEALRELVEDVLPAGLGDNRGVLCLTGTPGPIPYGRFYEVTEGVADEDGNLPLWSVHRWTLLDNVLHPEALRRAAEGTATDPRAAMEAYREETRKLAGWSEANPFFVRNFHGRWVRDEARTMYRYEVGRNSYDGTLPLRPDGSPHAWTVVLGGDIATEKDKTAAVALAFAEDCPTVYQVAEEEALTRKTSEVEGFFRRLIAERAPVRTVVDPAGLGNAVVRELREVHGLPVEVAQKSFNHLSKFNDVSLVNGHLGDGHIRCLRGGDLEHQLLTLERDPRTHREKSSQANDLADSFLYAALEVLTMWHPPLEEEPVVRRSDLEERLKSIEELRDRENERGARRQAARASSEAEPWMGSHWPEDDGGW